MKTLSAPALLWSALKRVRGEMSGLSFDKIRRLKPVYVYYVYLLLDKIRKILVKYISLYLCMLPTYYQLPKCL